MQNAVNLDQIQSENCSMLVALAICGGNLFHNEIVDAKNYPSFALTRPNIGLKCKLAFHAFEGNKDGITNL